MKPTYLLYGALAAAVLVWWWVGLRSDDESEIRSQLDRVVELVEKQPGEKALESADRARRLAALFATEFEMELKPVGVRVTNSAELARPFVGLRRQAEELSVSFDIEDLEVAEDFPTASLNAVASLTGTVGGRRQSESFRVLFAWKKEGREWRIESLQVTERLEGGLF